MVGSANSSNSVRLKEVALEHGAARAERVDFADQTDEAWFEDARTIGVASGEHAGRGAGPADPLVVGRFPRTLRVIS
ncbi:hypothetical protein GCM10020260_17210 [Nesterenkonia halobia]|uniref:Uncharacterized protein n=1 Tax=Nesterenkonia halobia TaxID=37922 RepID=A0ABP6REM6_9MICC